MNEELVEKEFYEKEDQAGKKSEFNISDHLYAMKMDEIDKIELKRRRNRN